MVNLATCQLDVNTTLPLVCICSLLSFLCGVGIGANDLSANFAMVVGSGSLNMRQAIIYCTVFELLGAAFMGGHVSSTIRNGIVDAALFAKNKDVVVVGMTCATFAAALWLYLSTVFGLPVSITHTVVGSIIGFAVFASGGFLYVKSSGLAVIVVSWVAAPVASCAVTALLFYVMRRDIFKVPGRSFSLALKVLPYCLGASLLVDYFFILIEKPPIMSQALAQYLPLTVQYVLLMILLLLFCVLAQLWVFPQVAEAAMSATSFVWESEALRTEPAEQPADGDHAHDEMKNLSFFKAKQHESGEHAGAGSGGAATSTPETRHRLQAVPSRTMPPPSDPKLSGTYDSMAAPSVSLESASASVGDAIVVPPVLGSEATMNSEAAAATSTAAALAPASLVMSSIARSDSSIVRKGGSVRLAPVQTPRPPSPLARPRSISPLVASSSTSGLHEMHYLPGHNLAASRNEEKSSLLLRPLAAPATHDNPTYGTASHGSYDNPPYTAAVQTPASVHSDDEFGEADWEMDHPMQPIRFGGILIKPFNPRAEYLFTGLQVVAGSMSSFVHGAVAGANATATFVILYDTFTNHELETPGLSSQWSMLPAMLGIAIGMFGLGASLMKTVGMELVTVTPARGWCIQTGGTLVTMILTGIGIPVSLSQSQVGAAIGCGVLDAKLGGVSWNIVTKVVTGWVVTLIISALTTGVSMWVLSSLLCS